MEDPKTKQLKAAGNGLKLVELLAAKEAERKSEMDQYIRPEEYAYEDSLFLTEVKQKLREKEGEAGKGAARKTRRAGI